MGAFKRQLVRFQHPLQNIKRSHVNLSDLRKAFMDSRMVEKLNNKNNKNNELQTY